MSDQATESLRSEKEERKRIHGICFWLCRADWGKSRIANMPGNGQVWLLDLAGLRRAAWSEMSSQNVSSCWNIPKKSHRRFSWHAACLKRAWLARQLRGIAKNCCADFLSILSLRLPLSIQRITLTVPLGKSFSARACCSVGKSMKHFRKTSYYSS